MLLFAQNSVSHGYRLGYQKRQPGKSKVTPCCPDSLCCRQGTLRKDVAPQPAVPVGQRLAISRSKLRVTSSLGPVATVAVVETSAAAIFAVFLGYCTMAGAVFRSVPQIVKSWKHKSVEGLSVTAIVTELLCLLVNTVYNLKQEYPFNTYGEVVACLIQDVIILGMIAVLNSIDKRAVIASSIAFGLLSCWMFSPLCSLSMVTFLQLSTLVVMPLLGRIPQIVVNFQRGNSGMLSTTTCLLNVAGSVVRIYTTIVLTQDGLMLAGMVLSLILNGILLAQCIQTSLALKKNLQQRPAIGGDDFGAALPSPA